MMRPGRTRSGKAERRAALRRGGERIGARALASLAFAWLLVVQTLLMGAVMGAHAAAALEAGPWGAGGPAAASLCLTPPAGGKGSTPASHPGLPDCCAAGCALAGGLVLPPVLVLPLRRAALAERAVLARAAPRAMVRDPSHGGIRAPPRPS